MKKFSIPFTKGLFEFLKTFKKKKYIDDIYFSDGTFPSAREIILSNEERNEVKDIKEILNLKLNYVYNPSWYSPQNYLNLKDIIKKLDFLYEFYQFDIITLNNTHFLLNIEFRKFFIDRNIKIRLSVNNRVDNLEKLKLFHEEFGIESLTLDRNINRDKDELDKCIEYAKNNNIEIFLLVNEGCLPNCPFKQFCDILIAQNHLISQEENQELKDMLHNLGCVYEFENLPFKGLQSPFISPTWIDNFDDYIKFKISGRNVPIEKLKKIIEAYIFRKGDILYSELFSTYRKYENFDFYDLDEFNFYNNVKNCKLQCHSCDFCKNVYNQLKENLNATS
jgi:hypothetical protein